MKLTIIHDPDAGCITCALKFQTQNSDTYCEADFQLRKQISPPATTAHMRSVSRHPAPDWCPIRHGSVVIEREKQ